MLMLLAVAGERVLALATLREQVAPFLVRRLWLLLQNMD
jgi:hypothetical protein